MKRALNPRSGAARHDTAQLPPGDFFFAPGAIEGGPQRGRWGDAVEIIALACLFAVASLALAAAIGFSAGWLTARGWLL